MKRAYTRSMKYISRIDTEYSAKGMVRNQHCWFVRILAGKPEAKSASFSDSRYQHDSARSLIAAQNFRDMLLRRHRAVIAHYKKNTLLRSHRRKKTNAQPWRSAQQRRAHAKKNNWSYITEIKRTLASGEIVISLYGRVLDLKTLKMMYKCFKTRVGAKRWVNKQLAL